MEKKRTVGVIVFGIIGISIGLAAILIHVIINQNSSSWSLSPFSLPYLIAAINFIVSGISMLKLRNWGRILFLWLMIIYALFGLFGALFLYIFYPPFYDRSYESKMTIRSISVGFYFAVFLLPSITSIYYFTRHKVKEQFR